MERKTKPLSIYYCGQEKCDSRHYFGPAIRTHYLMHFILAGKGFYHVGDKIHSLEAGEAFLIRPNEITYYEADSKDPWEYTWIAFDGIEADRLLEENQLHSGRLVSKFDNCAESREYFKKFLGAFSSQRSGDCELLGYFYLIFSALVRELPRDINIVGQSYWCKAREYIANNYSYPILITDIARYAGVDRTYLYKLFMQFENKSPKQVLLNSRVRAAKDLLDHTSYNITEIALSCGFHDSSSFCKTFLQIMGMTPNQFRKEKKHENIQLVDSTI